MTDHLDDLLTRAEGCGDPGIQRNAHRVRAALADIVSDLAACDRRRRSIAYRHARAKHPGPWDGCVGCADRAREVSR